MTHDLTNDLRAARTINPRLLRVLHALHAFDATSELQLLTTAPASLRTALLPVGLQAASTTDPEALARISAHLINAADTPVNVTVRPTRPATPAAPATPDPSVQTPDAPEPPAVTAPKAAKHRAAEPAPVKPAKAAPKNTGRIPFTPQVQAQPAAPVKPEPVFTDEMGRAADRLAHLSQPQHWTLPELSTYLRNIHSVDIHPKDLKRLRQRNIIESFSSALADALNQVPDEEIYTDPEDARNTSSPHYERFFELNSLLPDFTPTRDAAFIAARMRDIIGARPYIDKKTIEKLKNGQFNNGADWLVEPGDLDTIQDALLRVMIDIGRDTTPPAEEAEPDQIIRSDYPTTYVQRLRALKEAFATNDFSVADATRILGSPRTETIRHLLRMSDHGDMEYLRRNIWRAVP